ncbi:MAG TPA: CpsD/CapB family tyrosine-protein kinase [Terriglobales bacterium]|jgi:protein-tyrosine kinase|nr:CpsD/CapB family tyrosine-protein kinase [Terriglobales bacterium]
MSRIHEALKKAEQERSAVQATGAGVLTATPIASPTMPAVATPDSEVGRSLPTEALIAHSAGYLRFDDLRKHCAHPQWHLDPNVNVFINSALTAHGSEQFRTLRSRLYQMRSSQQLRTLLVTSSVPAEGKTFVTNNLAQAIVRQPDRRALIIDADLRCSRLHVPLGAPASPGLTDYLRGEVDELAIIQHGLEGNLCFIPGGNAVTNPSELLSNGRMKVLLDRVMPVFDWVILDSAPLLPVADSSLLADLVDGALLVIRAGQTPVETAQRACQELQGRNIVGVVLNAVGRQHAYGAYYSSTYGYGYGYGHSVEPNPAQS